jgi:hypothetical protein
VRVPVKCRNTDAHASDALDEHERTLGLNASEFSMNTRANANVTSSIRSMARYSRRN